MDRQGKWKLAPAYDLCYSYTPGGKWTNRHQLSLNGKQDNFTMEDLQKVGENMGIRKHKQIIEEIQETVSHWHETAKDCGVKPEHADFIGENLLLFGKQLHTIHMPDIANEQEEAFMKAMRNDDFNTILKLKMRGYQPSENTLKSLQPDVSATTFIAAAKIFQMEGMLKSLQDINPRKARLQAAINVAWNWGISTQTTSRTIQYNSKYINCYISYFDLTINIFTFVK